MWYSGKPRLWKENNRPYIPTYDLVGMVFNMGLISALNRALSKYSSAKEKQIMEIATIRS